MQYANYQWNGGISNDPFAWQPGSVSDASAVDVLSSSRGIRMVRNSDQNKVDLPASTFTKFFIGDADNDVDDLEITYTTSPIAGHIRNAVTGVSIYSISSLNAGSREMRNYARWNVSGTDYYLLFTASGKIHRFPVWTVSSVTEDWKDVTTYTSSYRPVFADSDRLWVGYGDKVASIDVFWTVKNDAITLRKGDVATYITRVSDQVHVFAQGTDGHSRQYVFNDLSYPALANRVVRIPNCKIWNGCTVGNHIYLKGRDSFRTDVIYDVVGYFDPNSLIYRSSDANLNGKFVTNDNPSERDVMTVGDFAYFGGNSCVYEYGNLYPGFPKSITRKFTYSGNTNAIGLHSNLHGVWVGYASGKSLLKDALDWSYSTTSASFVETLPYVWPLFSQKKRTKVGNVSYLRTGIVKIYASVNDGAYVLLWDSSTRTGESVVAWAINRDTLTYPADFQKIKFKIELLSIDWTSTPELHDISLGYETVQQDVG